MVDYAEKQLSPGTLKSYKPRLEKRIIPAIGHIKLAKLQPHHLMEFYNNLGEEGIRLDSMVIPNQQLLDLLATHKKSELGEKIGISFKTINRIYKGEQTNLETAQKLCSVLEITLTDYFEGSSKDKLSTKTIKHHHSLVSTILSTAVKWNLIHYNPATRVDSPKVEKYKPGYYEEQEIYNLLTLLQDEPLPFRTAIHLTIDTGIRKGELAGLQWSDVDFEQGTIHIRRQRQYVADYGVIEKAPKTENGHRTITVSGAVMELLSAYQAYQISQQELLGDAWEDNPYILVHDDGTAFHPHLPYKQFTDFLKKHQLPKITFHELRHTNASLLISAGVDVVTLSNRLGHGDKNVTLNTYSHIIKSKEAEVANKMDVFYQNLNATPSAT